MLTGSNKPLKFKYVHKQQFISVNDLNKTQILSYPENEKNFLFFKKFLFLKSTCY